MTNRMTLTERRVDRVHAKQPLGPDEQVDDKALVIVPGHFQRTDPFLALAEDWFSSPGFEWHPHRGIETVTMVLDGVLEHGDNLGHAGALEPGDVQWMTAGRGIIHRELAFRNEHAHILQLWVNLPAADKLVETRYQDLRQAAHAVHTEPGVKVQVISGTAAGVTGPALNHHPITGLMLTLDPGTTYAQLLPADERAFAFVLDGRARIGHRPVEKDQVAWSDPVARGGEGSVLPLRTPDGDRQTRIMLFSGRPLGEPVAAGGPFVMNSREEIEQAFRDFRSGKFGQVPRAARLGSTVARLEDYIQPPTG
ncbi:pirin family protein [Streptomyces sp. RLB1-33]|nr:pirin family protein [Streptomyces sp. RLB1-33]QIY74813.1 pirin family protein [Streptomyces sp. RLB1-33]